MGQRKRREKTAADVQAERVTSALEETDRTGRVPDVVKDNPGQFLRDMYEVWHRQGGKEGGRWRNSIRKTRGQWLTGRDHVASLHQKLMGRVRLGRSDVRALVGLFLERWRYGDGLGGPGLETSDGYAGYPAQDRRQLRNNLLEGLTGTKGKRHGLLLPSQAGQRERQAKAVRQRINVEKVLRECDVLITLSRHKIAIGSGAWQTIRNTWYLFNDLYEYDRRRGSRERLFVWVIDLGPRDVAHTGAFEEYFNAGLLALQLASFANFESNRRAQSSARRSSLPSLTIGESQHADDLWNWLVANSCIVLQNMRIEEIESLYGEEEKELQAYRLKDIGVTAEHVLPSTTPRAWGRELRHLYGKEIAASDATFTVFMRNEPWNVDGHARTLRYFAHTPISISEKMTSSMHPNVQSESRSEELLPPDPNYDHAFRLVYWSARQRLDRNDADEKLGWESLAYLRKIGFRVLRLPDFLRAFSGFRIEGPPADVGRF